MAEIVRRLCHLRYISNAFRCLATAQLLNSSRSSVVSRERKTSRTMHNKVRKSPKIEDIIPPIDVPIPSGKVTEEEQALQIGYEEMSSILNKFSTQPIIRELTAENGINAKLFIKAFRSFRLYCLKARPLDPELSITFKEIATNGQSVDSLFVYFLTHARKVFPHLECMEDLKIISDLTKPHNWYPLAREIQRKVIFHCGPTNSGKTYEALKRFREAKTGFYCGPLRLLATEIYMKMNDDGVPCDLVTGEDRRYAYGQSEPSSRLSCTVEMLPTSVQVDVAVIDEIQMLRDETRGWAWTRALLGVAANEIHLCGEASALHILRELLDPIGEHIEVHRYERKSPLSVETHALGSLSNLQDGDCIVCFQRRQIYNLASRLDRLGIKRAVIYGSLPPGTKLAQAAEFNDPNNPCNILVATDAIGMGLNLNIRRVIFETVRSSYTQDLLPNFMIQQIAGRAGRYGSSYPDGKVLTFNEADMPILKRLMSQPVEPIVRVGLAPTYEQLESFSLHLPNASFVSLLDIFKSLCSLSEHFFISSVDQIKNVAEIIDGMPLTLKDRYIFCISPVDVEKELMKAYFIRMVRRFSTSQTITYEWFCNEIKWPVPVPTTLSRLLEVEQIYGIVDLYLWLHYRFPGMFPDQEAISEIESQLDNIIQKGIAKVIENIDIEKKVSAEDDQKSIPANGNVELSEECMPNDTVSTNGEKAIVNLPFKRKGKKILAKLFERGSINKKELMQLHLEIQRGEYMKAKKRSK